MNEFDGRSDARYGHMLPSEGDQNWDEAKEKKEPILCINLPDIWA